MVVHQGDSTPMRPPADPDGSILYMPHPAAELFPMLEDNELKALASDILARGLIEPIILDSDGPNSMVLDGRNRLAACRMVEVEPRFLVWNGQGGTPTQYVLATNLKRRHLNASQRAMIAADALPLLEEEAKKRKTAGHKRGADATNSSKTALGGKIATKRDEAATPWADVPPPADEPAPDPIEPKRKAREEAAKTTGASPRYVQDAKTLKEAAPDLAKEVREGKKTLPQANKLLKRREAEEARKSETREMCSVADLEQLANDVQTGKREPFGTIYLDPPWQYDTRDGVRGNTEDQYETMPIEAIRALPIGSLAAKKSHIHLWVTVAFQEEAYGLLRGWGFEPRSQFVWVKPQMGLGHYWRLAHEVLLLGVRGDLTFNEKDLRSWAELDRGAHSAKPEQMRERIERASPGPRLELFARRTAPGWVSWGNELERAALKGAS